MPREASDVLALRLTLGGFAGFVTLIMPFMMCHGWYARRGRSSSRMESLLAVALKYPH